MRIQINATVVTKKRLKVVFTEKQCLGSGSKYLTNMKILKYYKIISKLEDVIFKCKVKIFPIHNFF